MKVSNPGCMYYSDGLNLQSELNNNYESEFIAVTRCNLNKFHFEYNVLSMVVLRGSVPLVYSTNLDGNIYNTYTIDTNNSYIALKNFIINSLTSYKNIRFINIIDQCNNVNETFSYMMNNFLNTRNEMQAVSIKDFH